MSGLEKLQFKTEDTLQNVYRELEVLIAEDDYDAVASGREHLKALYLNFREAHTNHHVTLQDESDIKASSSYLYDVQQQYIEQQRAAKTALNEMRHQQQVIQESNYEQSLKSLGHLINLPPLELKKFSGQPDEFDNFVTTFNEVIGNIVSDPAAKLLRLKSQLTGAALDSIKMCRTDSGEDGYVRVMKILRDRFGSPYIVCNSIIERLIHGPNVRSPSEIRTLADELCNAEITLRSNQMYTEIDTQNNIIQICLRLESNLRYEWRSKVMKGKQSTGNYLNFSDFVKFVQEHADVVNDPLYGDDALQDRSSRYRKKTTVSSLPSIIQGVSSSTTSQDLEASSTYNPASSVKCPLCLKNHKLYTCYKFRNMPIDKRYEYVKTNNLCVLCLKNDHSVSDCRSTYTCRINDCGEKHSSALHVTKNQSDTVGNCVQTSDKSNVSIPTVPVIINRTFQTSALLDTGSSTSFCTRRLMNILKLQGANISYQLKTLHGTNNHCSEAINLHVSSRNGAASLEMNNVLVVEEIPVERCSVSDVSEYPHLNDLSFTQALQVDLLIGQDHSAALVPIGVRRGPVGSPFAVPTMMGWSLNGCVSANIPSNCVTSNLAFTNILDANLHLQDEETTVHKEQEETLTVMDAYVQHSIPQENTKVLPKEILYVTLGNIVIILLSLCFFVRCVVWICTFCSLVTMVVLSNLEASYYASMGGVLLLVEYVSYIVPSYVSIYTVSHPMTVAFYDAREYTRL